MRHFFERRHARSTYLHVGTWDLFPAAPRYSRLDISVLLPAFSRLVSFNDTKTNYLQRQKHFLGLCRIHLKHRRDTTHQATTRPLRTKARTSPDQYQCPRHPPHQVLPTTSRQDGKKCRTTKAKRITPTTQTERPATTGPSLCEKRILGNYRAGGSYCVMREVWVTLWIIIRGLRRLRILGFVWSDGAEDVVNAMWRLERCV